MTGTQQKMIDTRRCSYVRLGQKIGRLIAWRQQCERMFRSDDPDVTLCWQHRGGVTR